MVLEAGMVGIMVAEQVHSSWVTESIVVDTMCGIISMGLCLLEMVITIAEKEQGLLGFQLCLSVSNLQIVY